MIKRPLCGIFFIASILAAANSGRASELARTDSTAATVGTGNAFIHVIPALSPSSVKNGEKLTLSAVVKAPAGVQSVTADLGGIETIALAPNSKLGGIDPLGTLGIWSAEWTGHDLQEKIYDVTLKVTDRAGHQFEDKSLHFSDPAAGLSTPGTPFPPNGGIRELRSDLVFSNPESTLNCAVIDAANGVALFGTNSSPGVVVKVALGAPADPPTRVGAVTLNSGENAPISAVFDPVTGVALFGTNTSPGIVVKVALGAPADAPTRVGALTLNTGENILRCAVIDSANGVALFGTGTTPGIVVKVALGAPSAPPTRVGGVPLGAGENNPLCAVIDTANGVALFGTNTTPGIVVKVALNAPSAFPTRVGAVTLAVGENGLNCAVIDAANGVALFGTNTSPGIVVKVALGLPTAAPTEVGTGVTLMPTESILRSAVIDAANGVALFGTATAPGIVIKVALNAPGAAPSEVGSGVPLMMGENNPACAVFSPANGVALFGTSTAPGIAVKVALNAPAAAPSRVSAVTLNLGESGFAAAVLDTASGTLLLGTDTLPGVVVKVALGAPGSLPTRIGAVTLNTGEDRLNCAVLDAANGVALFGTQTSPAVVIKVALNAATAAPTRVGAVTFMPGEDRLFCGVLDAANGVALFGTYTTPAIIVKVALNAPAAAPTRVGALTLAGPGEERVDAAVLDAAHGVALFATQNGMPSIIVKVALGAPADPPTRVGAVTLNANEPEAFVGVIDAANGVALFGLHTTPGIVVKVALGAPADPPTRVGAVTLDAGLNGLYTAVIDTANGLALFGSDTSPGKVVKVMLGAPTAPPTYVGALTAKTGDNAFWTSAIDTTKGLAYFPNHTGVGVLPQVAYTTKNVVAGTRTLLADDAGVADVHFFSHAASGNLRLAIYDDGADKQLLWQSPSVANTGAGAEVVVPISAGTPPSLRLAPGTYFLAWQSDSVLNVPSFTQGVAGDGFFFGQPFDVFPGLISAASQTLTAERYTEFITYNAYTPPTLASAPTATPSTASVSEIVTFTAAATSYPGAVFTYTWNFGDGSSGTGASTTHSYAAAGTYTVVLTVTDGGGGVAASALDVTIFTPNLTKPSIALNFAKSGADSIKFSGTLPIPAGFSASGKIVTVKVGNVTQMFTLDSKGSAKTGSNSFKLSIKASRGLVAAQMAKFSVSLSKGNFAAGLAASGLTNATVSSAPVMVLFAVNVDTISLQKLQTMSYTAKAGKSGKAK